jgi:hypothetical protein
MMTGFLVFGTLTIVLVAELYILGKREAKKEREEHKCNCSHCHCKKDEE